MKYNCIPYIIRYNKYKESPYYGTYINVASWCNQPHLYHKKSYREFCNLSAQRCKNKYNSSYYRYLTLAEKDNPLLAEKYFDMKYKDICIFN